MTDPSLRSQEGNGEGMIDLDERNITTAGDVDVTEGTYGRISCAGDLRMTGKVQADSIKSAGDLMARGDVLVENMSIFGNAEFRANLKASSVSTFGDLESRGTVDAGELKVYGSMKGKVFNIEKLTVYGDIGSAEEINCDSIEVNGELHIEGAMNIGSGILNIMGHSSVNEIFCQDLRVNADEGSYKGILAGLISRGKGGRLEVQLIEGDDITLENTTCDIVRGKNIKIGREARIRRVEYQESLEIFENGEVKEREEF